MKNWKILSLTLSFTSILLSGFVTRGATAESLTISDNGSGSTSEVHAEATQNTNVSQENTGSVENNVQTDSNTGNNSVSDNTGGDTAIQTGDVTTEVVVTNTLNQNAAATGCCPQGSVNGSISGNGSDSTNGLNISYTTNTNINSNNTTNITNNINGSANTGNNSADDNNGNVSIKTGDILVTEKITNRFNINKVEVGIDGHGDFDLSIFGNGSGSVNNINFTDDSEVTIITTNIASIINTSNWDLNTGNNSADRNIGNVDLETGDIVFKSEIINEGNINDVKVPCCDKPKPIEPPIVPPKEEKPPKDNPKKDNGDDDGDDDGDGKGGGDILGSTTGSVLPETGINLFILALIGNIAMLFLGTYLRLRSGRSPAVRLSI